MAIDEAGTQPEFEEVSTAPETPASVDEEQKDSAQRPTPHKRIKYRVQYVGTDDAVLHERETAGPHHEDESSNSNERPAFEIVSTFLTRKKKFEKGDLLSPGTAPSRHMLIHSVAIMHALRSIVQYYPTQDLMSDIVEIKAPYAVLVHYYDDLMDYREKFKPGSRKEMCYREKDAYEDIGILKAYLDEHVMPAVREEQERNKRGYTTFDMRWVQLRPGQPFLSQFRKDGKYEVEILHAYRGGTFENPPAKWSVEAWKLEYDGHCIGRKLEVSSIARYDGELPSKGRPIDLEAFPREETVEKIIAEGKLYWNFVQKQCKWYKGKADTFPYNEVEGLVMVDFDAHYVENSQKIPNLDYSAVDPQSRVSDCGCSVCGRRRVNTTEKAKSVLHCLEIIYPKETDKVTEYHYLLLPNRVPSFVFRTRTWEQLNVNGFSEPNFDENMIDNLVMDNKRVQTLKALAKSFVRLNRFGKESEREPWSADFVKGKGNGLIFLLHGKPGVGKTCTAECIAAFTSRPLMILTSSDIGTSPKEVEANLTRHFKTARSWGAVLLIDEADVFMERRSTADLNRNSLVAGFLRALEFYDGILFLTTNRVGSFDDAFISRIHVQLYYPDFDDESRQKVWQTFIDKLDRERGDYIRLNIDAKEYLEGKELKAVKWNGREIRNAFQTAVALAEYEATKDKEGKIVLTDKHLKSVVEMSRDFKEYLDELHLGDEGKRAERRHERLDK